ncbi:C40 family peptidase [Xanthomonas translucens]|nr:C40 family peptidase [Xanthomonas translucens]AVY67154.1 peptidase P60 [Xanthomonas translucens pv. undulosa]MCT8281741.1 C40 family peptidase [Xanthomonas translucens pv. undulosa]MCT8316505.1 C40 family peptidase [Xanthomonas translucens pv. undulosa]UKE41652.1 C40 family peptidase [Xanthomonas translucens pv. undulosa]
MEHATLQAIQAHAMAEYPRECCGLIVATADGERYFACRNTATTPSEHFRLTGKDHAAAADQGEVLALVHSHPNAPAAPSDADRLQCEMSEITWHIVSVGQVDGAPECGDVQTIQPCGYVAPLIGRQFAHGVLDCYTLLRDFYARELGIQLRDYPRDDEWWKRGENLYEKHFREEGFSEIADEPRRGDVFLMQIRSEEMNHAGVYLGDGQMLHHLHGRLSEQVPYGGYWLQRTTKVIRHHLMESRA